MIKRERRAEGEEETSGQRKKDVRRRRRQRRRGRDQNQKKAMNPDKLRLNGQAWQCLVSEKEEDQGFFWGRHNCNDRNQRQAQSKHKAVHTVPLLLLSKCKLGACKGRQIGPEKSIRETVHRAGKWLYGTVCDSFLQAHNFSNHSSSISNDRWSLMVHFWNTISNWKSLVD